MRVSAILVSGLAAVATATTSSSTWGSDPYSAVSTSSSSSSSSSSSTSYSGWGYSSSSSSSTKSPVSTSTSSYSYSSYDPTWSAWTTSSSTTKSPVSTSTSSSYDPSWSAWTTSSSTTKSPVSTSTTSSTTVCPMWTGGTAAPAYYTNLPASIKSALPSWTGAPPSDYCFYTSWMESFSSCTAPVSPAATTLTGSYYPTWSSAVSGTSLLKTGAKATGTVGSVAYGTWTGTR
jgi:hypothetical protein